MFTDPCGLGNKLHLRRIRHKRLGTCGIVSCNTLAFIFSATVWLRGRLANWEVVRRLESDVRFLLGGGCEWSLKKPYRSLAITQTFFRRSCVALGWLRQEFRNFQMPHVFSFVLGVLRPI